MINKYILCLGVLVTSGLGYASFTFAQTATDTPTSTPPETSTEAVIPTEPNVNPDITTEANAALSAQQQDRILNLASNITNRIDAATSRLTQIADRLESRQQKSLEAGIDVATSAELLSEARATLAAITLNAVQIDQLVFTTITSENPRRDWERTYQTISFIKADLQQVRGQLLVSASLIQESLSTETTPSDTELVNPELE